MTKKTTLLVAAILSLYTQSIYSQPKSDLVMKRNFAPVLDSMTGPPADCIEAWSYVSFDSLTNEVEIINSLNEQHEKIGDIVTEITNILNGKKDDKPDPPPFNSKGPPGGGSPGTVHPGRGNLSTEELNDIWEDLDDAYLAITKMSEVKEQFKNEIQAKQLSVNEKLHNTLNSDHAAHLTIINEFMQFTESQFKKHRLAFRENMIKIDAVMQKYNYGSSVRSLRMRSEFFKMQLSQAENLKFLSNITKEFIIIGANFYKKS